MAHNSIPTKGTLPDAPDPAPKDDAVIQTAKPDELLGGRMVTIRVGSPPTDFFVHEAILKQTKEAQFFYAAFTNGFKETETGILELPEDDAEVFRYIVCWLYTCSTAFGFVEDNCDKRGFFTKIDYTKLLILYILASKYMMHTLQDAIVTEFWGGYGNWDFTGCIFCMWEEMRLSENALLYFEANTMIDCLLEKLLVDCLVKCTLRSESVHCQPDFNVIPERLMRAALIKVNRACHLTNGETGSYKLEGGELCSYHLHGEDYECSAPKYLERVWKG